MINLFTNVIKYCKQFMLNIIKNIVIVNKYL